MASHDQIKKNMRDTNGAFERFRRFVHSDLPTKAGYLTNLAILANVRKRYTA